MGAKDTCDSFDCMVAVGWLGGYSPFPVSVFLFYLWICVIEFLEY